MEDKGKSSEEHHPLEVSFVKIPENGVLICSGNHGVSYDYIMFAICKGEIYLELDDQRFTAGQHSVALVRGSCQIYNRNNGPSQYWLLRFTEAFTIENVYSVVAATLAEVIMYGFCYKVLDDLNFKAVKNMIKLLKRHTQDTDTCNSSAVTQICFNLVFSFISGTRDDASYTLNFRRKQSLTMQFLRLCNAHCFTHHNVEFYAQRLCMTRGNLRRIVKEVTGQCPKSLIERQLIRSAKDSLDNTPSTIYAIAEDLNFNSSSGFISFFRNHTGQTPSQYRNRTIKNNL